MDVGRGGKPFEPFEPFEGPPDLSSDLLEVENGPPNLRKISGGTGKGLPSGVRACASFGSVFNIKAVAALCKGGHIRGWGGRFGWGSALCTLARGAILGGPWGAILGGAPLMADISVYARLRGMRPNLRPATYWKLWTSVGGKKAFWTSVGGKAF